jgi:hypothetical protein
MSGIMKSTPIIFTTILSNMAMSNGRLIGRFRHFTGMCKPVCCRNIGEVILLLRMFPAANGELLGFIAFSPTYNSHQPHNITPT